jgi:hypothetical protein
MTKEENLMADLFDVLIKYDGKVTTTFAVGVLEMLKSDLIKNQFKSTLEVMANEQR